MYRVALRMLIGDRFKFTALVFTVAAAAFLISQQVSIFTGLMDRTTSQIKDVGRGVGMPSGGPAGPGAWGQVAWVMHPSVRYIDELRALPEGAINRVRSAPSVAWAVPLYKGFTRAMAQSASGPAFRQAILMGFDDATLAGAPSWMLLGSASDLAQPDAVILDDMGYRSLFPDQPLRTGDVIELNDRRATIVGICRSSPPFATFPVIYTKYASARQFVGRERNLLPFILAAPREGVDLDTLCASIERETGLKARPAAGFARDTIRFYIANTGIPVNFGITIVVGVIVGLVVTGQTFLLFVLENTKSFAALKAMGATERTLRRMVALQALLVGVLGLSIGIGGCAIFFAATREIPKLRNFLLHGEVAGGTGVLMMGIALLACAVALARLRRIEPAVVFRG